MKWRRQLRDLVSSLSKLQVAEDRVRHHRRWSRHAIEALVKPKRLRVVEAGIRGDLFAALGRLPDEDLVRVVRSMATPPLCPVCQVTRLRPARLCPDWLCDTCGGARDLLESPSCEGDGRIRYDGGSRPCPGCETCWGPDDREAPTPHPAQAEAVGS